MITRKHIHTHAYVYVHKRQSHYIHTKKLWVHRWHQIQMVMLLGSNISHSIQLQISSIKTHSLIQAFVRFVWFFPFISTWHKSESFSSEIFCLNSSFCLVQIKPLYAVYTPHRLWHFSVPPSETAEKWGNQVLSMDSSSGKMPRATRGSRGWWKQSTESF